MIADTIRSRFTKPIPLLVAGDESRVKLELKPYLQPFERELALRELRALVGVDARIEQEHGLWLVKTDVSEEVLLKTLTYWQHLGRMELRPTLQKTLEFTQKGLSNISERADLHRARRLRYGPHDLHEYRGKFFPQLVRSLINISGIPTGSVVLDPMCGSGTTPCEAVVSEMQALGADLNPLSSLIAKIKASIPSLESDQFQEAASGHVSNFQFDNVDPEALWEDHDLMYLRKWFDPASLRDVASIVSSVEKIEDPIYRDFFRVCLSNIVRSVSWQKETDLRVRKEMKAYSAGIAQERFIAEARSQIDRIYPYLCVLNHTGPDSADIRQGNAVNIAAIFPEYKKKVDLLITSPPYATALPYLDTDRLSLIVVGLLPRGMQAKTERSMVGTREVSERERLEAWSAYESRRSELPDGISNLIDKIAEVNHRDGIGFRRRNLPALLGKYFLAMLDAMRSAHELMRPGAYGYYVVGNNSTELDGQKIEIPTDDFLYELGASAGWTPVEKIPMELIASRDIFRGKRGSSETILCFQA